MYVATDGVHPHSVPLYVDIMSIITIETIELKSKLNAQICKLNIALFHFLRNSYGKDLQQCRLIKINMGIPDVAYCIS